MTYEYVCQACGHQWEAEQSIKDSPLRECVSCGADKAKRLVSGGTGFLLKGGGWYADLYGSPGAGANKSASGDEKPSKAATSGGDGKSAAAGTSSTESTPAAATKPAGSSAGSSSASSGSTAASPAPALAASAKAG